MTRTRVLVLAALVAGLAGSRPALAAPVAVLEQVSGAVSVLRHEQVLPAQPGLALAQGDSVRAGPGGSAVMSVGGRSYLEVGPDSTLQMLRLPYASFAVDLSTEVALQQGFLRAVWRYDAGTVHWPLVVRVQGRSLSPRVGEYFFDTRPPGLACVAAGELVETAGGGRQLHAPSCLHLAGGDRVVRYDPSHWIVVRSQHELDAAGLPLTPLARGRFSAPATEESIGASLRAGALPLGQEHLPSAPEYLPPPRRVAANPVRAPVAAASATASVAAPLPPPGAGGGWVVQVASLATPADAEAERARVAAFGFAQARVVAAQVRGTTWYRVVVPGFASAAQAQAAALRLQGRPGGTRPWVSRQP